MAAKTGKRQREVVRFWRGSAERDRKTAQSLLRTGHYDWSLFLYHLAIEKLLKALVVQGGRTPPFTHDLVLLARFATLSLTKKRVAWLTEITKFNIEVRYPEEKAALYRRATRVFAHRWHRRCTEVY